jgi:PAS domain S-box-containing protein
MAALALLESLLIWIRPVAPAMFLAGPLALLSVLVSAWAVVLYHRTDESIRNHQRLLEQEQLIREMSQSLYRSMALDDLFQSIANQLGVYFMSERCFISRWDASQQCLQPPTKEYLSRQDLPSLLTYEPSIWQRLTEGLAEPSLHDSQVHFLVKDAPELSSVQTRLLDALGAGSCLICPVHYEDQLVALLFLQSVSSKRLWSPEDRSLVRVIADQAALAIHQAELRQRLETQADLLNRIMEASIAGIYFWHRDGRILQANDRFLEMLAYSREELQAGRISWRDLSLKSEECAEKVRKARILTGLESQYRRRDGRLINVLVSAAFWNHSDEEGVAMVTDISEQKQTERRLQEMNESLGEFTSIASHDLKAPLRKVLKFSELLERSEAERLSAQGRDYLARMRHALFNMQFLLDDLLALSSVANRPLQVSQVDMAALLAEVVSNLDITSEHSTTETNAPQIGLGPVFPLEADPSQMMQLVQNLVENGLKFRRADVPARVTVWMRRLDDMFCQLIVEDNGIGIAPADRERIFQPFERLQSQAGQFAGTGIGLATCRKIAERHGGTIAVESVVGQGSRFMVTLPLRQPEARQHRG